MTPKENSYQADLELALAIADAADSLTLSRFNALDLLVETKPDNTPVTDADRATEELIRATLAKSRPNDKIIGEEFGGNVDVANLSGRYWVLDPIDGTKNFMRGVPIWATLIALVEVTPESGARVVVGVVSAPALHRRWYASEGGGAFLITDNSEPTKISVSKVSDFSHTSFSYSDLTGWGKSKNALLDFMDSVWRTRGHGDFWSHMLVAEGAIDLAAEPTLALWDMAALDIIVREAGGKFTDFKGSDGVFGTSAISSNGLLHSRFLNIIIEYSS